MKLAYFIIAHHKPNMLLRMLNAIYSDDNIYLIHIDSGADEELQQLAINLAQSNENIKLLPSRYLMWGGWSLVQVELDALRFLLNWDSDWAYYINMSGQDFPLVSQTEVKKVLSQNSKRNYIQISKKASATVENNRKFYILEDAGELKVMGERKPFEQYFDPSIKPSSGSQWKMITREFAEYAATSYLSFEMQDYFRFTFVPDEQFFQSLIMNSPFAETTDGSHMRCIRLEKDKDGVIAHAGTFKMDDLTSLYSNGGLFARKFDEDVDGDIIQFIEKMIGIL